MIGSPTRFAKKFITARHSCCSFLGSTAVISVWGKGIRDSLAPRASINRLSSPSNRTPRERARISDGAGRRGVDGERAPAREAQHQVPFGLREVTAMSATVSPATNRPDGVRRVRGVDPPEVVVLH